MYNDKTIHCIIPKDNAPVSKLYLLGLLNSCLFEYLYRAISQETDGRAFSQVKTVYVKQLPIIIGSPEQITTMIDLVTKAIKETTEGKDITDTQNKIDALVLSIYSLSAQDFPN